MTRAAPSRPGVEAQRQALLEAAWRVLARRSLEDTRVEDLLREAGVSRQTFYRCFPNLEEVFRRLHEEMERVLREAVSQALAASTSPEDWLGAALDAVFRAAATAGPTLATIEREETRPGSPFEGARARRQEGLAELILTWARARYELEVDPWRVRGVLMAIQQLTLAACRPEGGPDALARARAAAEALARGLLLHEGCRAGLWQLTPHPGGPTPPVLPPVERSAP